MFQKASVSSNFAGSLWLEGRKEMSAIQERFVVDPKGRKTGVIIPLARYRKLMEDLHDLAVVAERRDEKAIPFEELKRRLKRNGLL
jgi:hypothetical protein